MIAKCMAEWLSTQMTGGRCSTAGHESISRRVCGFRDADHDQPTDRLKGRFRRCTLRSRYLRLQTSIDASLLSQRTG